MFRSVIQRKDGSTEKMLIFYLNASISDVVKAFNGMKKNISKFVDLIHYNFALRLSSSLEFLLNGTIEMDEMTLKVLFCKLFFKK